MVAPWRELRAPHCLQVDGVAKIGPGREENGAASGRGCCFDGVVDGGSVESLAIALGAEFDHVIGCTFGLRLCGLSFAALRQSDESCGSHRDAGVFYETSSGVLLIWHSYPVQEFRNKTEEGTRSRRRLQLNFYIWLEEKSGELTCFVAGCNSVSPLLKHHNRDAQILASQIAIMLKFRPGWSSFQACSSDLRPVLPENACANLAIAGHLGQAAAARRCECLLRLRWSHIRESISGVGEPARRAAESSWSSALSASLTVGIPASRFTAEWLLAGSAAGFHRTPLRYTTCTPFAGEGARVTLKR